MIKPYAKAICLIWALISPYAQARDHPTIEKKTGDVISAHFALFATQNAGNWPTNWNQLTNLVQHNRYLLEAKRMVIPELFAFVPTNLMLTGLDEGKLITIQRIATKEYEKEGRYFIFRDPDNEFRLGRMSEQEAQTILLKNGVTLPEPNPEEVRFAKAAVEKAVAEEEAIRRKVQEFDMRSEWRAAVARLNDMFVTPPSNNPTGGSGNSPSGGQIRPVPVSMAVLLVSAIGFFIVRLFCKRKTLIDR